MKEGYSANPFVALNWLVAQWARLKVPQRFYDLYFFTSFWIVILYIRTQWDDIGLVLRCRLFCFQLRSPNVLQNKTLLFPLPFVFVFMLICLFVEVRKNQSSFLCVSVSSWLLNTMLELWLHKAVSCTYTELIWVCRSATRLLLTKELAMANFS